MKWIYWIMLLSMSQLLFLAMCISSQWLNQNGKVKKYIYTACDSHVTSKCIHIHVTTSMCMHCLVGTKYFSMQ